MNIFVKRNSRDLLVALLCPIAHGIPWLTEYGAVSGILAVMLAVYLLSRNNWMSSLWFTWVWSTLAIAIAFHWSPAAMAYTLSSGLGLGMLVTIPLILWDGLRLALGYWIAKRLSANVHSIWIYAIPCFLVIEYFVPSVFPWRLGFMLMSIPMLIQAVDVFGTGWPTVVLFAIAGFLVAVVDRWMHWYTVDKPMAETGDVYFRPGMHSLFQQRSIRYSATVLLGTLLYSSYCYVYWSSILDGSKSIRVGLVQVDPSYTTSLGESQRITREVASQVDLVCWPESSGGNTELDLVDLRDRDTVFARSREPERGLQPWPNPKCELLLGGKNYTGKADAPEQLFVTAMLIDKNERIVGRCNKRYLMPFGEYVPFEDHVPGLSALFSMADQIAWGIEPTIIESETGARIGTMLCFEDMVPSAASDMENRGANLLVSLINASAFESKFTLYQHRLLAQLRSLECRRYFLRCSATGETCVISPFGEVTDRIDMQKNGVLIAQARLIDVDTIYSKCPWLLSSLATISLCMILLNRIRIRCTNST